jgi:hypothetical protein
VQWRRVTRNARGGPGNNINKRGRMEPTLQTGGLSSVNEKEPCSGCSQNPDFLGRSTPDTPDRWCRPPRFRLRRLFIPIAWQPTPKINHAAAIANREHLRPFNHIKKSLGKLSLRAVGAALFLRTAECTCSNVRSTYLLFPHTSANHETRSRPDCRRGYTGQG